MALLRHVDDLLLEPFRKRWKLRWQLTHLASFLGFRLFFGEVLEAELGHLLVQFSGLASPLL